METINALIAHFSSSIAQERDKPNPCSALLEQARIARSELEKELDALMPSDPSAIEFNIGHYSPMVVNYFNIGGTTRV